MRMLKGTARMLVEICMLPFYIFAAVLARFVTKPIDVGLGPEPLINNVYHKRALEKFGYTAETFAYGHYYITNAFDRALLPQNSILRNLAILFSPFFFEIVFRYRAIYIYFNGGIFFNSLFLWRVEPLLYRLAKVKVVVMPYGSDVQALSRCPNLLFKHAVSVDYPFHKTRDYQIREKIDLWTRYADHLIGGCDWVDYMSGWDTLMLAHFSIDTESIKPPDAPNVEIIDRPIRILHAPNHKVIKGTDYFVSAVQELREEGVPVELILLERLPNEKVLEAIRDADLIADQLIVGWYAMFALEAMANGKPVLCYLREDLVQLFTDAGLVEDAEIPIISCTPSTVKETIRQLVGNRDLLREIGSNSRCYVEKHHSLEAIGSVFDRINRQILMQPSL